MTVHRSTATGLRKAELLFVLCDSQWCSIVGEVNRGATTILTLADRSHGDVTEATSVLSTLDSSNTNLGVTSLAAYGLGGPIVHTANGHGEAALGSLGLRIAVPVVGALIGSRTSKGCPNSSSTGSTNSDAGGFDPFCIDLGYFAEGFVVGMVTASVIDIAFLSWSQKKTKYSSPRPLSLSLSPSYEPHSGNNGLSLVGTF